MAPPNKKELASKEKALFKELLNLYETRQLKKGVKTADQILKKFPDNGETLCMKGLLLTHMGKRDEGVELVKKGIRLDLTSHIVWHVFGLVQKGEKNYEEALKSYTQALKFDKENFNLLQDAAHLQAHLRQYDALQDTREIMLKLRPALRRNWIALAVAYQLNGNLSNAKKVLQSYEGTLKNVPDYDFEHSEVMLYHVRILEELGETNDALRFLDAKSKEREIVDRTAITETRARLLSKLGNADEAEQAWRDLIGRNSDCYNYYHGFFKQKGISLDSVSDENRNNVIELLREFSEQQPRARAPRRLALTVSAGDDFKLLARKYIQDGLTRGIPSLFSDIKGLYVDTKKQEAIEEIVEDLKSKFASEATNGHAIDETTDHTTEPPTTYLWTLYFLAQHYSHLNRLNLALSILDVALTHTPTLPELHTCRARALKRAGDPLGALQNIEEARKLDGQDRFLNTKAAKYHLRADLSEEAQIIFGMFTKKDAQSPGADLEEMQSLLYLSEEGDAQKRLGHLGPALKKYLAIINVFDDIWNDQYDFHQYSIRRFIINVYLDCVAWEDRLREHPAYVKAALEAARIYIRVHDDPKLASASSQTSGLTDAEKKAQKKAKKAAKKNQDDAKKANASSTNEDKGLDPPVPKDEDPNGMRALSAPDGIEQAWKLLKPLATQNLKHVEECVVVYDVSVRRQKYLQAVKALLRAQSLDAEDPELHIRIVDLKQRLSSLPQPLAEPTASVVNKTLLNLLPAEVTLETFNSQYLQRNSPSPLAVLGAAKALHMLKAPSDEVESPLFGLLDPENVALDLKSALKVLQFLLDVKSPRAEEYRAACDKRFELSTVFKSPEELVQLRLQVRAALKGAEAPEDKDKQEVTP